MTVQRLTSTDAFVLLDLPEAEHHDGLVRCARKVLVDSSRALARSRTYAWAMLRQKVGGASAAVNAEGEDRSAAVDAFATEVAPRVRAGELTLAAGRGVTEDELSGLGTPVPADPDALVRGVLACAAVALGTIEGHSVAVEHDGGATALLRPALESSGATIVAEGAEALTAEADLLLFGSRPALVDHLGAERLGARVLVPTGDLPFTPRALAVARRRGIEVLPDFLTTAGPLAARAGVDPAGALAALAEEALSDADGAVVGACRQAELFLSTWVREPPFGRPIG